MRNLVFVILLGTGIPGTGWSQTDIENPWGPRASRLFGGKPSRDLRLVPADTTSRPHQPTHWKEGAIAGGVLLGLLGAVFGAGVCGYSETNGNCTGATLVGLFGGGAIGFTLGALIGGQFPKKKAAASPSDSTRVDR